MKSETLNSRSAALTTLGTNQASNCTCYACGSCLICLAFAPIVGIFLGILLGNLLLQTSDNS